MQRSDSKMMLLQVGVWYVWHGLTDRIYQDEKIEWNALQNESLHKRTLFHNIYVKLKGWPESKEVTTKQRCKHHWVKRFDDDDRGERSREEGYSWLLHQVIHLFAFSPSLLCSFLIPDSSMQHDNDGRRKSYLYNSPFIHFVDPLLVPLNMV